MAPTSTRTDFRLRAFLISGLLGLVALVGVVAASRQVTAVLQAANGETRLHFDQGLTALQPGTPVGWTNDWCGSCHTREFESWQASRHHDAGINKNFQAQFHKAPGQWCLNCHAPINTGLANLPNRSLPTGEPPDELFRRSPEWLTNGVDCLTCHVRDSKVLVAKPASTQAERAHPVRLAEGLGKAEFCAGCHQFRFKSQSRDYGFNGEHQQASLEEFLERSRGGELETRCHDCHMPNGDHLMPGGYDLGMLRRAVGLDVQVEWADEWTDEQKAVRLDVKVSARNVGHRVPGGEYFRFLTVHTTLVDATDSAVTPAPVRSGGAQADVESKVVKEWPQLETIRRVLKFPEGGKQAKPLPDTRLWPGETRRFSYLVPLPASPPQLPLTVRTEIWYHILDDQEARDHGLKTDEVEWLLRSADARLDVSP